MPKGKNDFFFSQICDDLTDAVKRARLVCNRPLHIPQHTSPTLSSSSGSSSSTPGIFSTVDKQRGRPKGSKDTRPRKRRPPLDGAADSSAHAGDTAAIPVAAAIAAAAIELLRERSFHPAAEPSHLHTHPGALPALDAACKDQQPHLPRPHLPSTGALPPPPAARPFSASAAVTAAAAAGSHGAGLASLLAGLRTSQPVFPEHVPRVPRKGKRNAAAAAAAAESPARSGPGPGDRHSIGFLLG
jgi:hypothetical protein